MNMNNVIELLKRAELYDEAAAVGLVMQQRAELLEALKVVRMSGGYHMMHPDTKALVDNAITKAEAAE